jgi:UDP-2,3-diacylglucosamine pyrophosphatase LpxH
MQTIDPPVRTRNLRVVRTPALRNLRTAWISDIHLGTRSSKAGAFLEFLRDHDFETLYIVGDLIDTWQMPARNLLAATAQRRHPKTPAQVAQRHPHHLHPGKS